MILTEDDIQLRTTFLSHVLQTVRARQQLVQGGDLWEMKAGELPTQRQQSKWSMQLNRRRLVLSHYSTDGKAVKVIDQMSLDSLRQIKETIRIHT